MSQYNHKEAFCLMKYRCESCGAEETLWNSRDGVTPFCINCRSCDTGVAQHVDWHLDSCRPDFAPPAGTRIFSDLTIERAIELRRRYVDRNWDADMARIYKTKDSAIAALAAHDLIAGGGGGPDIVLVEEKKVS